MAMDQPTFEQFLDALKTMHNYKGQHYDPKEGPRYQNWREAVGCEPWVACWNRIREKVTRVNRAITEGPDAAGAANEELMDITVLAGICWILLNENSEGT